MSTLINTVLLLNLLWIPLLIGGDYSTGEYDWNWIRTGALIYFIFSGMGSYLFAQRKGCNIKWWVAYFFVLASAVIITFSLLVGAAWVHVPPLILLYGAICIVFATALLPKQYRSIGLVVSTSSASIIYSFGLFLFPP